MTDSLYQLVLEHIRTGKPEADLMNCGCMGCQNRVNGICACEQAGYSPNGVRRPCKCSCQLPDVAERNRQAREQMAGYVSRAREEIAASMKPASDSFDRTDEQPIVQSPWTTGDHSTPLPGLSIDRNGIYPDVVLGHCGVDGNLVPVAPMIGVAIDRAGIYWAGDGSALACIVAQRGEMLLEPRPFDLRYPVDMERAGEVTLRYVSTDGESMVVIVAAAGGYRAGQGVG